MAEEPLRQLVIGQGAVLIVGAWVPLISVDGTALTCRCSWQTSAPTEGTALLTAAWHSGFTLESAHALLEEAVRGGPLRRSRVAAGVSAVQAMTHLSSRSDSLDPLPWTQMLDEEGVRALDALPRQVWTAPLLRGPRCAMSAAGVGRPSDVADPGLPHP